MKAQVRSYLNEVKWLYQKYTPTMDEYLSIALGTSYFMLATTSLVGMGDIVTKDSFEWIFNEPKIVNALLVLGRLMGDMRSHKVGLVMGILFRVILFVYTIFTDHNIGYLFDRDDIIIHI